MKIFARRCHRHKKCETHLLKSPKGILHLASDKRKNLLKLFLNVEAIISYNLHIGTLFGFRQKQDDAENKEFVTRRHLLTYNGLATICMDFIYFTFRHNQRPDNIVERVAFYSILKYWENRQDILILLKTT